MAGSSPLARGTQGVIIAAPDCIRFIPAGAGNTSSRPQAGEHTTVHPRWRGEHPVMATLQGKPFGSSPLARGTRAKTRELKRN